MPIHVKYLADFQQYEIYHVYNRTNNKEALFLNDRHRKYFLERYAVIVCPFVETFAWTLLDNHFHFLVRIKSYETIWAFCERLQKNEANVTLSELRFLNEEIGLSELIEFTFKRFFQSYAQSFNKDVNRKGNLFARPFKRVKVDTEKHLTQTVDYLHANAAKHRLVDDFTKYKWSSWNSFLGEGIGIIERNFIIEYFGGHDAFKETHLHLAQKYIDHISEMED